MTGPRTPAASSLSISDLAVRGEDGRVILTVPALEAAPGVSLAIEGPSGAGKSTFLYALAGLVTHTSGSIRWGATDLLAASGTERTRFRKNHLGMIFQDHLLFEELSPLANAAISAGYAPRARRRAIVERARTLLERFGLGDVEARTVRSFSGGERQRIAVARALAGNPDIILADEPTAALDRANADRLIDDLAGLAREEDRTLIVVSHDARLTNAMQRRVRIADGRLVEADAG
ncbi:ATP-binding cassette domain-containing protein [Fulvimarina sp. 2208YS6-2-32]|uniref:ATP-binding cassette domain-containing protein n=1 Tax=Fulvimarina uroteuthidis TaxID=3098149 RepID=A0ABU5I149_9HYPH|nr:ATP-binding cassette domain-containing protein [Fulvimarina sp. 2208YS6-2-32]MDY8109072.1 ATP-binding cassette domain-containing protein [Fulvimarina sp. 2208YS6-2-32]